MANEKLFAQVEQFQAARSELISQADALASDIASAIVERLIELFDAREAKQLSFERWLSAQFIYDVFYSWDIFTKDPQLQKLLWAVDSTQNNRSRLMVAELVNQQLLELPSSIGVNSRFVDIMRIGT